MFALNYALMLGLYVLIAPVATSPLPSRLSVKHLESRLTPAPPSSDPFYNVTEETSTESPGAILSYRKVPAPVAALALIPVPLKETWQVSYRTTDSFGNPTSTVTTILVPLANPDFSKVLSYQVAEDASFLNCAPSYALQFLSEQGGPAGTLVTQAEIAAITVALLDGWIVSIPDHLGSNAAFLAQRLAGQSTLDGIRATLNSATFTGVDAEARVVMWGYSGGSHTSAFAAELLPTYAPELNSHIAGVALGGTVPDLISAVRTLDGKASAGLIPAGLTGLANEYPEVAALFDDPEVVHLDRIAEFKQASKQCLTPNLLQFAGQKIFERYFVNPDFDSQTTLMKYLHANRVGQRPVAMPTYIYKAIQDEVSMVEDTDALYNFYCAGGIGVRYVRDLTASHATMFAVGIPGAFSWLKDRMDGKPADAECSRIDTVTALIDTSKIIPQPVMTVLEQLVTAA